MMQEAQNSLLVLLKKKKKLIVVVCPYSCKLSKLILKGNKFNKIWFLSLYFFFFLNIQFDNYGNIIIDRHLLWLSFFSFSFLRNILWLPYIHNYLFYYLKKREMLRLQHFYNKSQVVNCYWFKFKTNIKITFLT